MRRSVPIMIAVYIGGWLAVVLCVGFLTFAFSLPGTILCAVTIGMMMGGSGQPRWQAIPVALVFPAVVFFLLRSSKSELLQDRIPMVALLCFATFLVCYGLTTIVVSMEKKNPARPAEVAPSDGRRAPGVPNESVCPSAHIQTEVDLTSDSLQGRWISQREQSAPVRIRHLEIVGDRLVVTGIDPDGAVRWLAKGKLSIESGSPKSVLLSGS